MEGLPTETSQKEQDAPHPVIHRDPSRSLEFSRHRPPLPQFAISTSRASAATVRVILGASKGAGECSACMPWWLRSTSKAWDSPLLPPKTAPGPILTVPFPRVPAPPRPLPSPPIHSPLHLLELARLAVHARQQQPGCLADIVAVHRKAAAVAGMRHRHSDPLHQRGQHEEGPAQEKGGGDVLGPPGNQGCSDPARLTETHIPPLS